MRIFNFILISTLLFLSFAGAANYRGDVYDVIAAGDTLINDVFVGARHFEMEGTVKGDVYVIAQNSRFEGTVYDDVIAWSEEVNLRGKIGGMAIGFAARIFVDGEINDDLLAYGGEVYLGKNAVIHGDLLVGCGKLDINGAHIDGEIKGGAGHAFLNGTVGGNVDLSVGYIEFGAENQIAGTTVLEMNKNLDLAKIKNAPANLEIKYEREKTVFESAFFYWGLISLLIAGILFVAFFKNYARDITKFAQQTYLKNTAMGFVHLILIPILLIILLILVLTIPVALIGVAIYLVVLYMSHVISALALGKFVMAKIKPAFANGNLFIPLIVGIILVVLLPQIPYIGWVITVAIFSFGMGSIILFGWQAYKTAKQA